MLLKPILRKLDEPIAEIIPYIRINNFRSIIYFEVIHRLIQILNGLVKAGLNPEVRKVYMFIQQIIIQFNVLAIHKKKSTGIPNFICEVPSNIAFISAEHNVLTKRCKINYGKPERIGPIFRNYIEWIWRIAKGFTHLRSEEHTSELQSLRHLVCR